MSARPSHNVIGGWLAGGKIREVKNKKMKEKSVCELERTSSGVGYDSEGC